MRQARLLLPLLPLVAIWQQLEPPKGPWGGGEHYAAAAVQGLLVLLLLPWLQPKHLSAVMLPSS